MSELPLYKNASESFGSGMTIRGRTSKAPAEWWSLFGCAAPNLQQLAIKILSLTCSASGCQRNWSVFEQMPYCLLMDSLAKAGHIREASDLFGNMKEKSVKSDGYAYSIMISAFCRGGMLQEAKKLAKDFEDNFEKYDIFILNAMLRAYCKAGDMESVMKMLRKMDEISISPDWNTFHILIRYFCREKLFQLAYRTIEDMHNKGHKLNEELGLSLISQLAKAGSPSESYSVYNMLRYSNRNVDKSLHETILNILVEAGLMKDAYVVMKDNMEMLSTSLLEKFARSFMKLGNINFINDVFKAFHRLGHTIDADKFSVAISRYIENPEKKELLLSLLKWMQAHGYVVDSSTRNLLLKKSHIFGPKQLCLKNLPGGSDIWTEKAFAEHWKAVLSCAESRIDVLGCRNAVLGGLKC